MFNVLIFIIGAGIMFYMGLRSVCSAAAYSKRASAGGPGGRHRSEPGRHGLSA